MHILRHRNFNGVLRYCRDSSTGAILAIDQSGVPEALTVTLDFTLAANYPYPSDTAALAVNYAAPVFNYTSATASAGNWSIANSWATRWQTNFYTLICQPPDLLLKLVILTQTKAYFQTAFGAPFRTFTGVLAFTSASTVLTGRIFDDFTVSGTNAFTLNSAEIS